MQIMYQKLSDMIYKGYTVGQGGLEPPTSPLSGVRSNQLSYRPKSCELLLPFRLRPRIIRRELQFTKEYVNKRH